MAGRQRGCYVDEEEVVVELEMVGVVVKEEVRVAMVVVLRPPEREGKFGLTLPGPRTSAV